ncbi:ogr/Delta-like zinc finger family protein [Chloroflexota bacterium]
MNAGEILKKKTNIKDTLCCPYCNAELKKWEVPQNVFTEWPNEYFYVCFNDKCSYFTRGWEAMEKQGSHCSYRLMYDHLTNCCNPIPVKNSTMLKDGIIE